MRKPACCGTAMLVAGTLSLVALTTSNSGNLADAAPGTAPTGPAPDAAAPPATPGLPTTGGMLTGYRPASTAGPTTEPTGGSTVGGRSTVGGGSRPASGFSFRPSTGAAPKSPSTHTATSGAGYRYTSTEGPLQAAGTNASSNWAGYAATGTTFTAAKATWRQPPADCSTVNQGEVTLAGFWVGLDGYSSPTVEQIGTQTDCEGTTPVYYAWFELFPQRLTLLSASTRPLRAGDLIDAEVTRNSLRLQDVTAGWTEVRRFSPDTLSFSSAEWVAESPSSHLTNFGTISFTSATASTATTSAQPIDRGGWTLHKIELSGGASAGTGAISDSLAGSAFQVGWRHG